MFVFAVVLVYLSCPTNGNLVRYRCRESDAPTSVTFTPAEDRVQGRYTVEYCAVKNPNITQWSIDLFYFKDSAKCRNRQRPDRMHSVLQEEPIVHTNNCTNVCYQVDFDLIFMGCYNIKIKFVKGASKMRPHDEYITIKNNLTLEMFTRNKPHVSYMPHSDEVILHWYLGLPVTDYTVSIDLLEDDGCKSTSASTNVSKNCTKIKWNEVRCRLFISLGNYQAIFRHHPLWSSLLNSQTVVSYVFNYTAVDPPNVGGDTLLVWWVCGGILLATAALFAAGMARRALRTRNYHKHVLESWRRARECEVPRPIDPRPLKPNVLILYAREGEHGQRAVTALKTLLQQVIGGQVLDLFSPEVLSLAAPAPSTWLRHTMLSARTRVVLLQSPAMQALFATNLNQSNLNLQEPLLGRRAMYRCPQYGDQLLLLALRLISETVSEHHDYSKYYLATYNSLESDIVQQVVPFRRYVLPAAVAALLRDLTDNNTLPTPATPTPATPTPATPIPATPTPATPTPETPTPATPTLATPTPPITPTGVPDPALLKHFYDSVERFITHVSDNPDYLMEELMIM